MGNLRPAVTDSEFEGLGSIDNSNGRRTLADILQELDKGSALLVPDAGTFDNTTRPVLLADWQDLGFDDIPAKGQVFIYNSDDEAPNFWDGEAWRDAMGDLT